MKKRHKFRFGVNVSGRISSGNELRTIARRMEDLGYSTFGTGDHLSTNLAPLTMLMTAADATSTLRVGSLTLGNDFRHPAFLAKEAATLDVLSGGRLEFGLGTGWDQSDYEQSGIILDPPGVRVSRLEEAITIIKALFGEQSVTYSGDYYKITNLNGLPKPIQSPHPPLVIGGGGKRMLTIAAREADIVSINFKTTADGQLDFRSATAEATAQKVEWIRQAAADRFDAVELNTFVLVVLVSNDPQQALADRFGRWGIDLKEFAKIIRVEEMLASPHFLVGTEAEVVEALQARREQFGISYYTLFGEETIEPFAPIVARLAGT